MNRGISYESAPAVESTPQLKYIFTKKLENIEVKEPRRLVSDRLRGIEVKLNNTHECVCDAVWGRIFKNTHYIFAYFV